jgi:hypothetical protein
VSIAPLQDSQLSMAQRMTLPHTPDEDFFKAFTDGYARYAADAKPAGGMPTAAGAAANTTASAASVLAELLGDVHGELSRRRDVSQDEQASYAAILNRAYSQGAMSDPQGFLKSLSSQELAVVQHNHCLADPIDPSSLSREGAYNLLLPEGWRADLNGDDIIEVGIGRLIQFPPADAPAGFRDAWIEATKGMKEMDIATYGLVMFTSMHTLPIGDRPMQRTLPTDSIDSYRKVVANILAMLDRFHGMLPAGQYERDTAFFGKLQGSLG